MCTHWHCSLGLQQQSQGSNSGMCMVLRGIQLGGNRGILPWVIALPPLRRFQIPANHNYVRLRIRVPVFDEKSFLCYNKC